MVAVFTMIIGVGGYWLITNYPNVIGLGLPFGYLNTIGITTGELMAQTGSGLFRMLPSSIILGLWSIIFILITNLRMTANKDYL